MDPIILAIIEALRGYLPPVFLGSLIDDLTGGACRWRTLQNKRSRREIPEDCFAYSGRQVLVRRDLFLDWWATTLSTSRQNVGSSVIPGLGQNDATAVKLSGRKATSRTRRSPKLPVE